MIWPKTQSESEGSTNRAPWTGSDPPQVSITHCTAHKGRFTEQKLYKFTLKQSFLMFSVLLVQNVKMHQANLKLTTFSLFFFFPRK